MAVMYQSEELDPSSAAVADRLRKQAKTRAVKLVREAIACPTTSVSIKRECPLPQGACPCQPDAPSTQCSAGMEARLGLSPVCRHSLELGRLQ